MSGTDNGKELQKSGSKLPATTANALGDLATSERPNTQRKPSLWEPVSGAELTEKINGVHLGRKIGRDGWNAGFQDESITPVYDAGIGFRVWQNSVGWTGVDAVPMEGHTVEAAEVGEDGTLAWRPKADWAEGVRVSAETDVMLSDTPFEEWSKIGVNGVQWGVVRVTGPSDNTRYYAMGADFRGNVDDWTVRGGIVEVQPTAALSQLSAANTLELPPTES